MKKIILIVIFLFTSTSSYAKTHNEESNKSLVVSFYNDVLINRKAELIDNYIGSKYIQHNPNVPNGKKALKDFIINVPSKTPGEIVRVLADGNLVALHVKRYTPEGKHNRVIVDIFRVEGEMIVEHWDVIQSIPEHSVNGNTMY